MTTKVKLTSLSVLCCLFASCFAFSEVRPSVDALIKMPGWKIIQDGRLGNCITCHTIQLSENNSREKQGNFAPALTKVGSKYTPEQLRQWVTDARLMNPDTLMPPYGSQIGIINPNLPRTLLTSEQINEVVDLLVQLK